jgi:hypothetical protein
LGGTVAAGFVAALAIAAFLAPFASTYADGLEAVGKRAFQNELIPEPTVLVLDDYSIPAPVANWQESAAWQKVSVSLAGVFGTVCVAAIAWLMDRSLKLRAAPVVSSHDN